MNALHYLFISHYKLNSRTSSWLINERTVGLMTMGFYMYLVPIIIYVMNDNLTLLGCVLPAIIIYVLMIAEFHDLDKVELLRRKYREANTMYAWVFWILGFIFVMSFLYLRTQ